MKRDKTEVMWMSLKELRKVKHRKYGEKIKENICGLVIVPHDRRRLHDSNYVIMTFVLHDKRGKPICAVGGSDVLCLDGMGGLSIQQLMPTKRIQGIWQIDCLPGSGCIRIFNRSGSGFIDADSLDLSTFEIFAR